MPLWPIDPQIADDVAAYHRKRTMPPLDSVPGIEPSAELADAMAKCLAEQQAAIDKLNAEVRDAIHELLLQPNPPPSLGLLVSAIEAERAPLPWFANPATAPVTLTFFRRLLLPIPGESWASVQWSASLVCRREHVGASLLRLRHEGAWMGGRVVEMPAVAQ